MSVYDDIARNNALQAEERRLAFVEHLKEMEKKTAAQTELEQKLVNRESTLSVKEAWDARVNRRNSLKEFLQITAE